MVFQVRYRLMKEIKTKVGGGVQMTLVCNTMVIVLSYVLTVFFVVFFLAVVGFVFTVKTRSC